ncbi:hypothetical protein BAY60_12045 [Prauserella muralis]|uniref:Uncharacterized protein n=1 Tax=Prauserella muralis TaxID=588067 RepID=A0A2V4AYY5_9PSEU|nr:ABC transporter permease [Prauserella muralis]PXY27190.1 hypothetical protein BAY60_12045 [Prauserella muralis]TWE23156.1 hypothetical protein FHX69_4416 [Prauserella muralis]
MTGPARWGRGRLVVLTSLVGALAAVVLGFLTFGAQTTAHPEHVPVAVSAPESGPLRAAAERVSGQGGDALSWRVTTPAEGRRLLGDKEVYGVLELAAGQSGPSATVVVSGAVNPTGTQIAQQALTGAGQALTAALAQANPGAAATPVRVETVHQTTAAGRVAPLGISALAWVGGLAAGAVLTLLAQRGGTRLGPLARFSHVLGTSVLMTGVLTGFLALWDSSLHLGWDTVGFLWLTSAAFAAVQGGLLRLLGVRAMAILGPLYLLAPSVASQVPETLNPAYEALLWSWTPFRFSTEALRSLLVGASGAPDVGTGIWVLGALLAAGLLVVLWPGGRGSAGEVAEPQSPDGVVDVGVDEAEGLPGAEGEHPAQHRHARIRR